MAPRDIADPSTEAGHVAEWPRAQRTLPTRQVHLDFHTSSISGHWSAVFQGSGRRRSRAVI